MIDSRLRYVLLDRDGVINTPPVEKYITHPDTLTLVAGAGAAIAKLNAAGFRAVVISNQQCIGKGIIDMAMLSAISDRMNELLAIDGAAIDEYFYCPHLAEEDCSCRKPKPGLIQRAHAKYGFELETTYFVGDTYTDLAAAAAAGCRSILVLTGDHAERYRNGDLPDSPPASVAGDLMAAAEFILSQQI